MRGGQWCYDSDAVMSETPIVVVIGGPNGAGKSTVAPAIIEREFGRVEFVNADAIARGLSGLDPDRQAFAAGRIMLRHIAGLAAAQRSFAFETTLASRTFEPLLRRMIAGGYAVHLIYVWVRTPEVAIERVRARIASGGHSVPETVIRRRFARSARNLFELYIPLATSWQVLENSVPAAPSLIVTGAIGKVPAVYDQALWMRLQETGDAK